MRNGSNPSWMVIFEGLTVRLSFKIRFELRFGDFEYGLKSFQLRTEILSLNPKVLGLEIESFGVGICIDLLKTS